MLLKIVWLQNLVLNIFRSTKFSTKFAAQQKLTFLDQQNFTLKFVYEILVPQDLVLKILVKHNWVLKIVVQHSFVLKIIVQYNLALKIVVQRNLVLKIVVQWYLEYKFLRKKF